MLLILLSFGRGIWALGGKSLWWDESLSLHRARGTIASNLSNEIVLTDNVDTVSTVDNHPPLYFLLLWGTIRLFGETEFALRFLSLAFAVLMVPLLYAAGKRLVDDWAGLAAAALGALSPMYLWYGQEARMYTMLAFLSLLAFYSFVRAFLPPSEPFDIRRRWPWIGSCMLASVSVVLTHYLGVLLIAFELLALGVILLRKAGNRRTLLLIMIAMIVVLTPLLAYAWNVLPRATRQPGFHFIPLPDLIRDLLNSFSLGLSVDSDYWYVLLIDLVFLAFLIVGFAWLVWPRASRKGRSAGLLLAGYLLLPIAAIYLASYVRPVYMNSRHLIFVTPPFYLLVGVGLTRWRRRASLVALLAGLMMVAGISYSTWNYFNVPAFDKDHHREWGEYLREHVRPGDVVVVEPPHIAELYQYYADSGVPWIGLPLLNGSREDTIAVLEDLRSRYDRIWLAFSRTPPWGDRGRIPEKWLTNNAFRTAYNSVHSYASAVLVAGYLPDWPSVGRLPHGAQPLEVRYSPSLRLEGYHLVSAPQPGKRLHVILYWAVDEPIPEEASVVLRLVDDKGQLWGQGEQCPFNGLYPMWQWQPGLILPDEHELHIEPGTPPGTYELELVLVSRPTEDGCLGPPGGPVAPAVAPPHAHRGDRVLLGTVDIERPETPPSEAALGIEEQHRARFDGLELLGSNVTPAELNAGQRVQVTLYWQAREAPLPDARFRLRLLDRDGKAWQETTIRPVGDSYPADRWQAGDMFMGQFGLRLPEDAPEGRYRVELAPEPPLQQAGMWAALRRRLAGEDTGLLLGRVEVQALPGSQTGGPVTPVPVPTDLTLSHPMLATLGDQVRFLGYELHADSVRAGETLSFTLYWQALRPMDVSYNVFTHLLGPSNQVIGQKDSVPKDGGYPTTLWQPGEIIADPYSFTVAPDAPPGNHPIEVGMYILENFERLPVSDANGQPVPDDRILLSEIAVLPALAPTPAAPELWHWFYLPLVGAAEAEQ